MADQIPKLVPFSSDISFAAQPSVDNYKHIAKTYASVVNSRMPDEDGYIDPTQYLGGVPYKALPVKAPELNGEYFDQLGQAVDSLPKPCLAHCRSGFRAAVSYVAYDTKKNKKTYQDFMNWFQEHPDYPLGAETANKVKAYLEN